MSPIFKRVHDRTITILRDSITRFRSLHLEKQIWLIALSVVFASILCGPCAEFMDSRRELSRSAMLRGRTLAELLVAKNLPVMMNGNELMYDIASIASSIGVKDAFITDKNGLIVAPSNRFHEDARKHEIILKAIEDDKIKITEGLGVAEFALPMAKGVAYLKFSSIPEGLFTPLWYFARTFIIMSMIMAAGVCLLIWALRNKNTELLPAHIEQAAAGDEALEFMAENIGSPIYFLDNSFHVIFANPSARLVDENVIEKHIIDIDRRLMPLAEEMEMLQLERVAKGGSVLWRFKDAKKFKYGLSR